jgi:hypothetical protein
MTERALSVTVPQHRAHHHHRTVADGLLEPARIPDD